MRLAIIAASSYVRSKKLVELVHVGLEVDLLSQRLSEPDAGFAVHTMPAERGLGQRIEELVAGVSEPIEALLFFFTGYALVSDEHGPTLLLDGERLSGLSLRRMRRLISQSSPSCLVVLDTVTAFDGQSAPDEVVRTLNDVLMGGQAGIHVLAANRRDQDAGDAPSPFTSLLALVLDWHSGNTGLSPQGLFAAMRSEGTLFSQIPYAELYTAPTGFDILRPSAAPVLSIPPAPVARDTSDDPEARADALVAAGDASAALAEYDAALKRLGEKPGERHSALYAKIGTALRKAGREADAIAYYEAALDVDPRLAAALQGATELRLAAGDHRGALELLKRWLDVDPNATLAAKLARGILSQARRWKRLAAFDELLIKRSSDKELVVELALELATLCREALNDPDRACESLERAAALAPADARIRRALQELYEKRGDSGHALTQLRAVLSSEPRNAACYRTALRLFEQDGQGDAAWQAACALEVLGEADVNESLLAGAHRVEGLLPIQNTLNEQHWQKRVFSGERDAFVEDLFAALGDAAIEFGLENARRKDRLIALDAASEQNPNTSTATVAKTLAWSARVLGIDVPKLHVRADLRTAFLAAPAREPTLVVSKSLGSGLTLPELAFLWSRQLTFLRPEHRLLGFFPSVPELAALVLAALSLGELEQIPFKKLDGDAKLFGRGLKRHLSKAALIRLHVAAQKFPLREATQRILAWTRSLEFAAGRAGLLACGSLEIAAKATRDFPLSGLVETEEQIGDLLAYSVSENYALLREQLGVSIKS